MSAGEQAKFYDDIKEIRGKKDLKMFVDDALEISKEDSTGSRDLNECLPLSVWEARGWERDLILKVGKPSEHPLLGTCYTMTLSTTWDEQVEKSKRS